MKIVDYYVDKEFNLYFEILFFSFSIFIVTALMLFFKHKILDILQIISLDFCVFIFIPIVKIIGISNFIYTTIKKDDRGKIGALISIIVALVGIIIVIFLNKL